MKVLVLTEKPFAKVAVDGMKRVVEDAGYEFAILEKYSSDEEKRAAVADADALIVRSDKIDAAVFEAAKCLKIVVRAGAGYDNIDLGAATAHDVCVMNTPGQNANGVAELVFGMMLLMQRNRYNGTAGLELKGKRLGIHAYGNVGRNVARIAQGFGMQVYAYDAFCSEDAMRADGVTPVATPEDLYRQCAYVSLHLPLTDATRASVNYRLLQLMPADGMLINTARREVVNEHDLLRIMDERNTFRYVTDIMPDAAEVFEQRFADRYFATPKKMGAQTAEANINAGIAAARQIVGYLKDGCERFRLNDKKNVLSCAV